MFDDFTTEIQSDELWEAQCFEEAFSEDDGWGNFYDYDSEEEESERLFEKDGLNYDDYLQVLSEKLEK